MTERIQKDELARRLAERMQTDIPMAKAWSDGVVETLYESFRAGEGVTVKGFGSFYVRSERST
jgi:nucleoid DNA-binding protein